ncbi:MAG: recombinase family protein [Candidatus Latescibacteria bacterium]|nr:recombinase family protein [Candidatus Latescibacterota bacterium]
MRTTRAAIYARYSSQEQTGGESIEYQLQRCREYIEAQGLVLPEESIFVDEARSGTSTLGRDEFNRMIALAKRSDTPFDVVVAWSTSRFGRNQDEAIFNKIGLRRQGVDVKFVSQPVPDGHMGTLIERIYEWKDEFDSIQIGEYAFEGQRQVTQKGFHGGGRAPYGYRLKRVPDPEGKRDKHGVAVEYVTFEVVEDEARVVRRIFEAYAQAPGYKRIAEELNAEGVQSPSGSTWDTSGIRNVLLNETYLGKRVWNRNRRNKKVRRGTRSGSLRRTPTRPSSARHYGMPCRRSGASFR